jgi:hypothetical protein
VNGEGRGHGGIALHASPDVVSGGGDSTVKALAADEAESQFLGEPGLHDVPPPVVPQTSGRGLIFFLWVLGRYRVTPGTFGRRNPEPAP